MLKGFRDIWLCANNRLSRLPFNFYEISYPEFALDKLHKYAKTDSKNEELQDLNALYCQIKAQITQNKNRLHIAKDVYIQGVLSDLIGNLEKKADEIMQSIEKLLNQSIKP